MPTVAAILAPDGKGCMAGSSKKSEFWETLKTIFWAVLLALIFRSFAYEPFHIPSESMKATLLKGDYIFVSKFSYGYSRYSFPFGLPPFKGRFMKDEIKRGDIAVFRRPNHSEDYIKRVIGLPGDKIQMVDGVLYINGNAVKKEPIADYVEKAADGSEIRIKRFQETLPEGKTYEVFDLTPHGAVDNTEVYEVPTGHYFMMGDNRDDSQDSRYLNEVGFVPEENFVGRAVLVLFSKGPGLLSLRGDRFAVSLP